MSNKLIKSFNISHTNDQTQRQEKIFLFKTEVFVLLNAVKNKTVFLLNCVQK